MISEMKVQYISDIHLELMSPREKSTFLEKFKTQSKSADALLLAGDIGNPYEESYAEFLALCASLYPKVFLIAGNHEFYKNTVEDTRKQIEFVVSQHPTISFLENTTEDYEGIRFAGSTLWSNITNPRYTINDTNLIRSFSVEQYQALHTASVEWLHSVVVEAVASQTPLIIMTHHLPLTQLIHPHYRTAFYAKYNQWFASALDSLVELSAAVLKGWFYGHTHTPARLKYYSCSFFCNPVGYVGENPGSLVVEMVEI